MGWFPLLQNRQIFISELFLFRFHLSGHSGPIQLPPMETVLHLTQTLVQAQTTPNPPPGPGPRLSQDPIMDFRSS